MNELRHHGVKGQKWGVRRFQNKDGSLTPAGKKRQADTRKAINDINSNRAITLKKGTKIYRVDPKKTPNAESDRMYANIDKKQLDVYIREMTERAMQFDNAKAYIHSYLLTKDIKIPSYKTQTEIEKSMLKDKNVQKEMKERYEKNPLVGIDTPEDQLNALRCMMGDHSATYTRELFSQKLKEKGFESYRDSYDRGCEYVERNGSLIIKDQGNNTVLLRSAEIDKKTYAKAYSKTFLERDMYLNPNRYTKAYAKKYNSPVAVRKQKMLADGYEAGENYYDAIQELLDKYKEKDQ